MLLSQARTLAQQWVVKTAAHLPGFQGAFLHGSTNWLAGDAVLPANSDLDLILIFDGPCPPALPGKRRYHEVLLDVSCLPAAQVHSADQILGISHLAGSLRHAVLLADPTGHLSQLQAEVTRGYPNRRWVYRRCEYVRTKLLSNLASIQAAGTLPDQVIAFLFGAGLTTHILLAAGLKNPTVRTRYLAARQLLTEYSLADFYPTLLEWLGSALLTRPQAEQHLSALIPAFDAAAGSLRSAYTFASDLTPAARPIAIDGSRALIEQGCHREAAFWLAVTYARCMKVLQHDAPAAVLSEHLPGFTRLLTDLGIPTLPALLDRSQQITANLPQLWNVAGQVIAANPEIETS